MRINQKPRSFNLCLMGLTLAIVLTFQTRALNAQTRATAADDARAAQDLKIQQLQDKLEEIQRELIELKKTNSSNAAALSSAVSNLVPTEPHTTTTAKASAAPTSHAEAEPEITDPSSPHSEPFAFADFTWLNGNATHSRYSVRNQILHAGDTFGRELHLRLPPSAGRHHRRIERGLSVQRGYTDGPWNRRRLPLWTMCTPAF